MLKQTLPFLIAVTLSLTACQDVSTFENQISDLKSQLDSTQNLLTQAQTSMQQDEKFIHTVFFWMKEDMTEAEHEQFQAGLQSLSKVESVKRFHWGKPAGSENRDVVDHSYDYALIIHFADQAGHDAYQPHEIHQAFVANNSSLWTQVKVYDTSLE
ncbi:MAG: Dabb family protein [Bacteroidota bacterium]